MPGLTVDRQHLSTTSEMTIEIIFRDDTCCVQGLDLSHDKFVDLCVLCGCDYTGSIKGIGPKKALNLIRQVRDGGVGLFKVPRVRYCR